MSYKRVLTWLNTHPGAASARLLATSVTLAREHQAELNGVVTTPRLARSGHWALGGMISKMVDELETRAEAAAGEIGARFAEARRDAGLSGSDSRHVWAPHEVGAGVAVLARTHDLAIAELLADDEARGHAESLIFAACRPVLLLPAVGDAGPPQSFAKLAVAWDGSRTATRAAHDALPMLRRAHAVTLIGVVDDKDLSGAAGADELVALLACHGVRAEKLEVRGKGRPTAVVLKEAVRQAGADALVMGAYGHSRAREFVLGGATMGILQAPEFPVLLSH